MSCADEGVSPVVGLILLLAISLITAGSLAVFVMEIEDPDPSPVTKLTFESLNDGDNQLYLVNEGGNTINEATKNLKFYVQGSDLNDNIKVEITGADNDLNPGERLEIEIENFSKKGRVKAIHPPSKNILAESESTLNGTGSLDITPQGADISAYQAPDIGSCDILVDDSWSSTEDSDQDENFKTISAALDNASSGDVIGVKKGTYNENHIPVGKPVTIASLNGPGETTIDAEGDQYVFYVTSDSVNIKGFKMANYTRHGVNFQDGSNSKVSGNIFEPKGPALSAVQAFSDVKNVEVVNNIAYGVGFRGYTGTCSSWDVNNNTVDVQNEAHHGIVGGGANWTISHNDIKNCGNPSDDGYHQAVDTYQFGNASDWTIENNNIHDSEEGIQIEGTGHEVHFNNIYNIENLAAGCDSSLNAQNNWWETTDKSEIDNMVTTNVDYTPWLDEPH